MKKRLALKIVKCQSRFSQSDCHLLAAKKRLKKKKGRKDYGFIFLW